MPSSDAEIPPDPDDVEVVVVVGALLHHLGMAIHREDHESYSLFMAAD